MFSGSRGEVQMLTVRHYANRLFFFRMHEVLRALRIFRSYHTDYCTVTSPQLVPHTDTILTVVFHVHPAGPVASWFSSTSFRDNN